MVSLSFGDRCIVEGLTGSGLLNWEIGLSQRSKPYLQKQNDGPGETYREFGYVHGWCLRESRCPMLCPLSGLRGPAEKALARNATVGRLQPCCAERAGMRMKAASNAWPCLLIVIVPLQSRLIYLCPYGYAILLEDGQRRHRNWCLGPCIECCIQSSVRWGCPGHTD